MSKPRIAFICIRNSCRSQIAEAFGHTLAGDVFTSCSAGTEIATELDRGAVRIMKNVYGIDMAAAGQKNKTLDQLPPLDGLITMGCGVQCPVHPAKWKRNWDLVDPVGKSDALYLAVIQEIKERVMALKMEMERRGKDGY
ncbi:MULTISPECIES: low molecular weight phosphatase family protein [Megasphaera]|uniref:Low molecular weight phosphotyrosine protein phosphatase n=1 Tax=Megasphaera vaginalis (ex Srinivasan et al. 2021) TaxID=1111454 RepID=U7UFZ4_9FIRM|nr:MULTISPECIES: low molecular weight phosphatase family protein [Megasphaera]ERT57794.1 low molecular weight phosphotyrosine protein phosphatase [Megasphaera vaginalis (ex Srinivasan et al. 2021)]